MKNLIDWFRGLPFSVRFSIVFLTILFAVLAFIMPVFVLGAAAVFGTMFSVGRLLSYITGD